MQLKAQIDAQGAKVRDAKAAKASKVTPHRTSCLSVCLSVSCSLSLSLSLSLSHTHTHRHAHFLSVCLSVFTCHWKLCPCGRVTRCVPAQVEFCRHATQTCVCLPEGCYACFSSGCQFVLHFWKIPLRSAPKDKFVRKVGEGGVHKNARSLFSVIVYLNPQFCLMQQQFSPVKSLGTFIV